MTKDVCAATHAVLPSMRRASHGARVHTHAMQRGRRVGLAMHDAMGPTVPDESEGRPCTVRAASRVYGTQGCGVRTSHAEPMAQPPAWLSEPRSPGQV